MARHLKSYVHVHKLDEAGNVVDTESFGPDDTVPEWAAKKIGDHCWADDSDTPEPDETEQGPRIVQHKPRTTHK